MDKYNMLFSLGCSLVIVGLVSFFLLLSRWRRELEKERDEHILKKFGEQDSGGTK